MTNWIKGWLIFALVTIGSSMTLWMTVGNDVIYRNFDGLYYVVVAKTGYDTAAIRQHFSFPLPVEYYAAHLPLYPLLIRVVGQTGVVSYPAAMMVVNLLATVAVGWVLLHYGKFSLTLALVWLFWWPRVWVIRSVGSPETLFVLWVVLSLVWFERGKYWLAGLAGALAVWTKSPGILLFLAYGSWFVVERVKKNMWQWKIWPVLLIPLAGLALFGMYGIRTGDYLAYFHSGDNIHLQALPFRVFDSNQPWVGSAWLEDVLWVYVVAGLGVWYALKKRPVWGYFGAIFYLSILFVSHRDISRYALPLVPVVLVGLEEVIKRREVRIALALLVIPMYFYAVNFLLHNTLSVGDWGPLL